MIKRIIFLGTQLFPSGADVEQAHGGPVGPRLQTAASREGAKIVAFAIRRLDVYFSAIGIWAFCSLDYLSSILAAAAVVV